MYIFEISCLSVASFAIIFSHSEGCLLTSLIVSFVVQKLLILIRSHLFIFAAAAMLPQSCPTLHNPRDGSPPGSPVPGETVLDRSHSDWREMVPHCGFDLHF